MLPGIKEENVLSTLLTFLEELKDFRTLSICRARLITIRWKLSQPLLELPGIPIAPAHWIVDYRPVLLSTHTLETTNAEVVKSRWLWFKSMHDRLSFSVILINKLDYHKIKLMIKHIPRVHSSSNTSYKPEGYIFPIFGILYSFQRFGQYSAHWSRFDSGSFVRVNLVNCSFQLNAVAV